MIFIVEDVNVSSSTIILKLSLICKFGRFSSDSVKNKTWMQQTDPTFCEDRKLFCHFLLLMTLTKWDISIRVMINKPIFWYCLTDSRQSWVMTSWRSTTDPTSCLLWLGLLMVPRCHSSCSAAATFYICSLPLITADRMLASKYYMKVSQKRIQHIYIYAHVDMHS